METPTTLRSFHGGTGTFPHAQTFLEKPVVLPVYNASLSKLSFPQLSMIGGRLKSSSGGQRGSFLACTKASETTKSATSDADTSEKISGSLENKSLQKPIFPSGVEKLIQEVCDNTEIAELKLKVGDFGMHLKRNVGAPKTPTPIVSPTTAPPIPSEPMIESAPAAPAAAPTVPQKSPSASTSPFAKVSSSGASKMAALEASGSSGYVIVSSPTVGSFRCGRTVKGKKQPPSCKEGDLITEDQTIGYIDQFGNELPVKSDVSGEVLKVLFKDGEAVSYGDPLVAVLPSFHGINK